MKTTKIEKFNRYAFADTATISGVFKSITTSDKKLVNDCNFNFHSVSSDGNVLFSVTDIDDMFNGCENAIFSHNLIITESTPITSAARAFKDCHNARIPVADISSSNIENCESMFENCYNAELSKVGIPSSSKTFKAMFKNAKTASLADINTIPFEVSDYSELFYGCTNATLHNLSFSENIYNRTYDCNYMFYGCMNIDSENLNFDNISQNVEKSDYMFYSAGENSSESMDDSVCRLCNLKSSYMMFSNSNFGFSNSYFQFYGYGDIYRQRNTATTVKSVSHMFENTKYVKDTMPVIVLGKTSNDDSVGITEIDEDLNLPRYGHYDTSFTYGITDFSYAYKNSSGSCADLRGISYNNVLNSTNKEYGIQNFSNMFQDCKKLQTVKGYIPSCGYTYDYMFSGCDNLKIDLSDMFKTQPNGWSSVNELTDSFYKDNSFNSYSMTSISHMFHGCDNVFSKNELFDLVGLIKTVKEKLSNNGYDKSYFKKSLDSAFSRIKIATSSAIPGLELVDYDINTISRDTGTIRYNSYSVEPYELNSTSEKSEYGIYSDYAKYVFTDGFYRYGGKFKDDENKYFYIMYSPSKNESTGDVVEFTNDYIIENSFVYPHDFSEKFNVDKSKGYWNEFKFSKLYSAMIYDSNNNFVKYAYVGPYVRVYHENRKIDGNIVDTITEFSMPVTYFDGQYPSEQEL